MTVFFEVIIEKMPETRFLERTGRLVVSVVIVTQGAGCSPLQQVRKGILKQEEEEKLLLSLGRDY